MRLFLAAGCAALLLALGVWAKAETARGDSQKGRAVYERYCVQCHGAALDGRGPDAPTLVRPPVNFHDRRSRARGDAEMEILIKQGQTYTDMHAWHETLNDQQVRDVIAYIRSHAQHIIE